jgi:hypothetical protein
MVPGEHLHRGSGIARDNLILTARRDVFAGARFFMEKPASGKGPKSENWR